MREIKFRFRVKDLRRGSSNYNKTLFVYHTLEKIMLGRYTYEKVEVLAKDLYTGLKDKNGKESYFNDLILMADKIIYQVVWYNWGGRIQLRPYGKNHNSYILEGGKLVDGEIVSTIYEKTIEEDMK